MHHQKISAVRLFPVLGAVVSLLSALIHPTAARAEIAPLEARHVVETIISKSKALGQKSAYRANTHAIESLVDFKAVTTAALGDDVSKTDEKQFEDIQNLLKGILTKTVYPAAPKFFKDVAINFTSDEAQGGQAHIQSTVTKGDRHSTVEYWLVPAGNSYQVVDIAIEGQRWTESIHGQFDEIIQKKGVGDLIARMKKRLQQIK